MWDGEGDAWDGMPAGGKDELDAAVDTYRSRFNVPPPTSEFMSYRSALAREILASVRRGERLTSAEMRCRLGMAPPSLAAVAQRLA